LQNQRSPDAALLNFIERLPTTIRDVILARCCKAFGRLQLTQYQDLFATFRAIVTPNNPEARAYACAMMTAVLELALHDELAVTHTALAAELETAPGRQPGSYDLLTPIAQKHWQAAREEFFALRKEVLDTASLHLLLAQPQEGLVPAGLER